jgi:hypothetical protein
MLVGRLRPLQHQIETQAVVSVLHERRIVHRLRAAFADDLLLIVDESFRMLERRARLRRLILEDDPHAFVEVTRHLEAFTDDRGVELDLRKDGGVGMKVDRGSRAARRANLFQGSDRLALLEAHFPLRPVALDRCDQLL